MDKDNIEIYQYYKDDMYGSIVQVTAFTETTVSFKIIEDPVNSWLVHRSMSIGGVSTDLWTYEPLYGFRKISGYNTPLWKVLFSQENK